MTGSNKEVPFLEISLDGRDPTGSLLLGCLLSLPMALADKTGSLFQLLRFHLLEKNFLTNNQHKATREQVALFDQTSFSKFLVQGKDAEQVLQRLCAGDVSVPIGKVVYTPLLNESSHTHIHSFIHNWILGGGFETDVTITRWAEDTYFIVSSTAQATRDLHWITTHIKNNEYVTVTDVSSGKVILLELFWWFELLSWFNSNPNSHRNYSNSEIRNLLVSFFINSTDLLWTNHQLNL